MHRFPRRRMLLKPALSWINVMKPIILFISVFLATSVPAMAAETAESIPDANPACMERNGPDCVLRSETAPPRVAAPSPLIPPAATNPSGVVVVPAQPATPASPGVVVIPAPSINPSGVVVVPAQSAMPASSGAVVIPAPSIITPGTATMQGVVGAPVAASPSSTTTAPGDSTVISPSVRGPTMISPRR
jgi:hypothetical protein